MERASRGDMDAFGTLVRRHQDRAWRIAYHYMGNHADAEEVAQEAFLKILDAAESYEPTAKFTTYLYRVIANLCLDRGRKKSPGLSDDLPPREGGPRPEQEMADRERDRLVSAALDSLSDRQRLAVVLRYYEDLSYKEIAAAMDATPKAVERLLARGRRNLEEILGDFEEK